MKTEEIRWCKHSTLERFDSVKAKTSWWNKRYHTAELNAIQQHMTFKFTLEEKHKPIEKSEKNKKKDKDQRRNKDHFYHGGRGDGYQQWATL